MDKNPYQSPSEQRAGTGQPTCPPIKESWRIVPTVLVGLLGVVILLFDLLMARWMVFFWSEMRSGSGISGQFAVMFIGVQVLIFAAIFAAGCLWIASAVAIWRCRWKTACIRFVLGGIIVAIPVSLSIVGSAIAPS